MHDLDGYEDATLLKQKVAACYTGFITREGSDPFGADDTPITSALEPGGLEILPTGSKITFGNPPTATEYTPFVKQRLRRLAAGMGISYEALSGDLSEVNYSSGRMGWAEFQRNIDMWQHQMLIPGLIARVADWFTSLAVVTGIVNQSDVDRMWWAHNPPRRTVVDPAKEFPAIRDGIRAGLMTLPEALRDLGKSFDSQMEEQAEANKELDRLGLTVESDARVSLAGGAKTAAEEQPTPTPPAPEVPA
jgi:lambda family phage portal protein